MKNLVTPGSNGDKPLNPYDQDGSDQDSEENLTPEADEPSPAADSVVNASFVPEHLPARGLQSDFEDSKSLGYRRFSRSHLPKIDYAKLVTLSLTNFREYKESIKVLGFSREWPTVLSSPSVEDLKHGYIPTSRKEQLIAKEAYLVLYQTIPSDLKYLVNNVKQGDVIGVWKALYKRFLNVTKKTIKVLKREWQLLTMKSTKTTLDQFISLVQNKAADLNMLGYTVPEDEVVDCLLYGLSDEFKFLQSYYSLKEGYSFQDVSAEALKFALNENMFSLKSKNSESSGDKARDPCIKFNTTGCSRSKCKYEHKKVSEKVLKKIQEKVKKNSKSDSGSVSTVRDLDQVECYKCHKKGHYANKCPTKSENSSKFLFPVFSMQQTSSDWILDSGSTQHITNSIDFLRETRPCPGDVSFTVGNSNSMVPSSVGSVKFGNVELSDVYLCNDCPINIVSESRLAQKGCVITKKDGKAQVLFKGTLVLEAPEAKNLYFLKTARFSNGMKPIA